MCYVPDHFYYGQEQNEKKKHFKSTTNGSVSALHAFPFWVTRYILHYYTIAPIPQEERFLEPRCK